MRIILQLRACPAFVRGRWRNPLAFPLELRQKAKAEGGNVLVEGGVLKGEGYESGCYVKPAIIEAENHFEIVQHETFAPILYLMKYFFLTV